MKDIKTILSSRNVDGKIYISDIDILTKHKLDMVEVREIRDNLQEAVECNGNDNGYITS